MKKRYFLLALSLFSFNAAATDSSTVDAAIGGAIGGGLGAAVGNEVAGREAAITGGALGAGAGAGAAVTTAEGEGHQNYRDRRHYDGRTYIDGCYTNTVRLDLRCRVAVSIAPLTSNRHRRLLA